MKFHTFIIHFILMQWLSFLPTCLNENLVIINKVEFDVFRLE
jgi:hypothetical protein